MRRNYTKLLILNFIYFVIMELLFKFFVFKSYDIGILYIIIFSFIPATVFTFFMSLFKGKLKHVINTLLYLVLLFVYMAETVYFSFYKTITGLSGILYGGQVMEFYNEIITHIYINLPLLTTYFIVTICAIIINIRFGKKHKMYWRIAAVTLISSLSLAFTLLQVKDNEAVSSVDLIMNTSDLMQSTNRFGIITAVNIDAYKLFTGFEEKIDIDDLNIPSENENIENNEKVEYNILDIDFDSLMNNTTDSTLSMMHQYFKYQTPSEKNDYTGLFKDKNLIFIVAEGFSPIAVDPVYTPTLYKLVNSSFVFDNYYQPLFSCSTSDGEFINQLSILPGVKLCSMKATFDVYLPYSLGNIMDKYNYNTYGFHGWTYTYYNRDITMPNLGYEYYGFDRFKRGYDKALKGIKDQWPTSDIDVIESSYPVIDKTKPFVAYYMSISGHLQYNFSGGNAISSKNKHLVEDMKANDNIKAYMATQIEFDKSLELLINKLESDGILDDTVIVISADHYPYGLSNEDIASYVDWMQNPNFDLYKNNLVIYNSKIETQHISKYTSSLDLLPTLLNLLGVEYDSRLLIGRDIFSKSEDLVIFNNKSWITSRGRYDYMKKKFEPFNGEVDQEYIDKINDIVDYKFKMSKLLISKDYYRSLGGL